MASGAALERERRRELFIDTDVLQITNRRPWWLGSDTGLRMGKCLKARAGEIDAHHGYKPIQEYLDSAGDDEWRPAYGKKPRHKTGHAPR